MEQFEILLDEIRALEHSDKLLAIVFEKILSLSHFNAAKVLTLTECQKIITDELTICRELLSNLADLEFCERLIFEDEIDLLVNSLDIPRLASQS